MLRARLFENPKLWSAVAAAVALVAAGACSRPGASVPNQASAPGKGAGAAVEAAGAPTATGVSPVAVETAAGPRVQGTVGIVNGHDISAEKFNAEFEHLVGNNARIPPERLHRIAHNVLQKLIESELRAQAIAQEHVELTDGEWEQAWREFNSRFVDGQGHFDEVALQNELARTHLTMEQLRAQIRDQRLQRKLVEKLGHIELSETDLKTFYDANQTAWMEAAARDVRPIVVKLPPDAAADAVEKARLEAQAASQGLRKGADFEEIALKYAPEPLPPLHLVKGTAEPELEKVAFALKIGEVSEPVRTRWGWYVLRLIEKSEQRQKTYPEVRDEIIRTLSERRRYLEDRRIVQDLRKKADVIEKLPF